MITHKTKPDSKEAILNILNPIVKTWFTTKFKEFTPPQQFGLLEIHSRNNILVSASTGSGKTLTGFLSILNELIDSAQKGILEDRTYAIYISPLKALSNDIEYNLNEPLKELEELLGKKSGIRIGVRTGDTSASKKAAMAKKAPHILITTPESLAIMLNTPSFREHLARVDWIIVDEVHALAENKRGVHLSLSLERLQQLSPGACRIGLSATVSPLEEIAKYLVGYEKGKERPCKIIYAPFLKELDLKVISPVKDLIETTYNDLNRETYSLIHELVQQHKTTVIFTNTRAGTERVVHQLKQRYPSFYDDNIGAHHGSLSKEHRTGLEQAMREGKIKVGVTSTSLELGIDIGYIDLVILLGSPKSVARALQRCGRAGHQLHSTINGRIIALDRDDLVENAVLLKHAIEHKIDKIHIPTNCLDVLSQHIYGIAIAEKIHVNDLHTLITNSYCYHTLTRKDFQEVLDYLLGKYISLEDRHIYAKIWYDEETGMIGKKGKLAKIMYMTNVGTIPDESHITVKIKETPVGHIDEGFLEKLKKGDIFVLGGNTYQFLFSRGMVAQVMPSPGRTPTVPAWFSDNLPLSFDLAQAIQRFKKLMSEKFSKKQDKKELLQFIHEYLYVDENSAEAIYKYFYEQHHYIGIPHEHLLLIEHYDEDEKHFVVFHSMYGRRVNDVISRAVAYAISRMEHRDAEIGISDNGFYVAYSKKRVNVIPAFQKVKSQELRQVMDLALDQTEVLKRRFRHCATRALMILRSYKGEVKRVGRQQVSSMILMSAVKRISNDFPILKEARREVLEDLMDIESAQYVMKNIEEGKIIVKEVYTHVPSPFAFNLVLQGKLDVMKADDKISFLKRMHGLVQTKIKMKGVPLEA